MRGSVRGVNWPNFLTVVRILLVPVFLYVMYAGERGGEDPVSRVAPFMAFVVFAAAAATDSLDGWLARRHERVTRLGQYLDPLADKFLIGAALVTLVDLRGFPAWAALLIVIREVGVSLLRSVAVRRGRSLPSSALGKAKTAVQIPMVMAWLLARNGTTAIAQDLILYLAVSLTLVSGLAYLFRAGELLSKQESAR